MKGTFFMEILENQRLDHLGIIAGTIKDLGVIEFIDSRIPTNNAENISRGPRLSGTANALKILRS